MPLAAVLSRHSVTLCSGAYAHRRKQIVRWDQWILSNLGNNFQHHHRDKKNKNSPNILGKKHWLLHKLSKCCHVAMNFAGRMRMNYWITSGKLVPKYEWDFIWTVPEQIFKTHISLMYFCYTREKSVIFIFTVACLQIWNQFQNTVIATYVNTMFKHFSFYLESTSEMGTFD